MGINIHVYSYWGDNHAVAAAMLEIADVLDEWSREGEYKDVDI